MLIKASMNEFYHDKFQGKYLSAMYEILKKKKKTIALKSSLLMECNSTGHEGQHHGSGSGVIKADIKLNLQLGWI